jgi:hypothetical protein
MRYLAACALLTLSASLAAGADGLVELRGEVVDAATGEPLPVRVTIEGEHGKWYFPRSASPQGSAVDYRIDRKGSPAMHTTLSAHAFTIDLPPGKYTVTAQRGKEYLPVEERVILGDKPVAIKLALKRWIHMSRLGWFSGDTHSHRPLSQAANLVLAEDLNICFPLSHWVTEGGKGAVEGNRIKDVAPKPEAIRVDGEHLIYPLNTEYEIFTVGGKGRTLGAVLIVGHKSHFERGVPPVSPVARQAHDEGALLDLEKHSWPWSLMIVPVMKVDLFELSNNHVWPGPFQLGSWTLEMKPPYMNVETDAGGYTEWGWLDYGFQTYYALLNCGFRIQPTAGTGSGVHPVPLGFGRVYVEQPDGFSYENWMKGLKAGRSFVTTGPMLFATIDGKPAGTVIEKATVGTEYRVAGSVHAMQEIERVEVIVNGQVAQTFRPTNKQRNDGGYVATFEAAVKPQGSSWIAVRTFEKQPKGRIRFAHSSPFHLDVEGKPLRPRAEEVAYIVGHLERELVKHRDALSAEALKEYETAIEVYRMLVPRE